LGGENSFLKSGYSCKIVIQIYFVWIVLYLAKLIHKIKFKADLERVAMHLNKYLLTSMLIFVLSACAPSATKPQPAAATQTLPQQAAVVSTSTPVPTLQPSPTNTLVPSPTETATPASSPTTTVDSMVATAMAGTGAQGVLVTINIMDFIHPVGAPLQEWQGVPIMPQATAGQEFRANVYDYTAAATLEQANQFYAALASSLGFKNPPATGYGGSGDQANHGITYFSYPLVIDLLSFDNDTAHVNVMIVTAP
jgi:hypothetical protein